MKLYLKIILLSQLIITLYSTAHAVPTNPAMRKSSTPFISGDTFRNACNHVYDETDISFDPRSVRQGDTIFINNDILKQFFREAHPRIQHRYIIVSHNSDESVPGQFHTYLQDPKIIAWFSQNIDIKDHSKLHPIPIGLANYHWPHGKIELVKKAMQHVPTLENRSGHVAYLNFEANTNSKVRSPIWNHFVTKPFCRVAQKRPYQAYLEDMKQCKFVISPPGNGLDCHRNWEALLMGCIPIMKHSTIERLFDDLPVILVDDWNIVTEEFIQQKYQEMRYKTYAFEKLYVEYWLNQIHTIQKQHRS